MLSFKARIRTYGGTVLKVVHGLCQVVGKAIEFSSAALQSVPGELLYLV